MLIRSGGIGDHEKLEAVRRLLGHRDYSTIKTYLDLTLEDLEQELNKLFNQP